MAYLVSTKWLIWSDGSLASGVVAFSGSQCVFDLLGRDRHIGQEVGVRALLAILRLAAGQRQQLRDEPQIELEQEAAVKEQGAALAALGVAGKLQRAAGEIGEALNRDRAFSGSLPASAGVGP